MNPYLKSIMVSSIISIIIGGALYYLEIPSYLLIIYLCFKLIKSIPSVIKNELSDDTVDIDYKIKFIQYSNIVTSLLTIITFFILDILKNK